MSYGSHIEGDGDEEDETVTVVRSDGRRDVFTYTGSGYTGPAGVHDWLTWDGGTERWTLTAANQWQGIYNADGRLIHVKDSAGSQVSIVRDNNRLDYVTSAADELTGVGENRLTFSYDDGRLEQITDPIGRVWTFNYKPGGDGRLWKINYPTGGGVGASHVEIDYEDDSNRIEDITARDGKMWSYTYDDDDRLDLAGQNGVAADGSSAGLESAGSIGGLLAVHDANGDEDYVYFHDANGNVGQLVAWASGYVK